MKFCCFTPMPWPAVSRRPSTWPYPNVSFDPLQGHQYYRSQIAQLLYAEECGFDWVGVGEDHMSAYSLTPNPCLILSILGYLTKRVHLAIMGLPLPLLNPIRAAEECAMVDVISGGRLIVGFVRGFPQNYAAYNIEPNESRERFDEASRLIIKAWTESTIFAWKEKYYEFPKVSLWPVPVQKPHPPLIYSANSEKSAVIGAKSRAMIGTIHLYNRDAIQRLRTVIGAYTTQARADGWEPSRNQFLVGLQTCIAETDSEAQRLMAPALDYQYGVLSGAYNAQKRQIECTKPGYGPSPVEENPPGLAERLANRMVLCGSPATVIEQVRYLRDEVGVGIVSMQFQVGNMDDADARRGMRLFGEEVLPKFRQEAAPCMDTTSH